jgi:putative FmdB family regulatory protein
VPTYEYRCVSCEHQFERFQRMTDEPVKECEVCGQPVKRLLFPVAVHFKGNGFYSTDYAKRNTIGTSGGSSTTSSSESSADSPPASTSAASDTSGDKTTVKAAGTEKSPVGASTAKND